MPWWVVLFAQHRIGGGVDDGAALASYARRPADGALEKHAIKIRARAIRRCGELVAAMEKSQGGRPKKTGAATVPSLRAQATADAGMTSRQVKTALRVANVPTDLFDAQVDSDAPPTVTALARQVYRSVPRYPRQADVRGP